MESPGFESLKIPEELLKGISKAKFREMTPIQKEAIPMLLKGRDVIGQAQTGTGKTAAFGIPLLAKIDPKKPYPQALVLAPTRELAHQISVMLRNLAKYMDITIVAIHGGGKMHRQIAGLSKATHVVVGTPGRTLDLMRKRKVLDVTNVKYAVIDEADKMFEMGFLDEMKQILSQLPFVRQTSLWSATINDEIISVSTRYMRNPRKVLVSKDEIAQTMVHQYIHEVTDETRDEELCLILDSIETDRGLIFCNTRYMVEDLAEKLQTDNYKVEPLHGRYTQQQREAAVMKLLKRQVRYLVTTDVASRGLDIKGLTHVINYEVPEDAEVYFHRIGRTGRTGESGVAITLVSEREEPSLFDIEDMTETEMQEWE
jgi:ATP-dependent RNA helicase DeaD